MVSEGAFEKLKSRFRILHKKCESSKDAVKSMGLAAVVLHNLCLEFGDMLSRGFDLTVDPTTNIRRSRDEIADVLDLTDCNQINYLLEKSAKAIRETLTELFWDEK